CKSAVIDFEGSNPSPTTIIHYSDVVNSMSNAEVCTCRGRVRTALIAERNRLKGTLTPDQLSETYAAFDLIRRKINQSKEAKKIA
ncbi:hypothetical protein ACXGXA_24585, partial [Salmonella enterica subsp. enterica serovar Infantis]